jgi:hypothetical protein
MGLRPVSLQDPMFHAEITDLQRHLMSPLPPSETNSLGEAEGNGLEEGEEGADQKPSLKSHGRHCLVSKHGSLCFGNLELHYPTTCRHRQTFFLRRLGVEV